METRLIIAYSLLTLMVIVGFGWAPYARHNTHDRKVVRQRQREAANRVKRKQDQD